MEIWRVKEDLYSEERYQFAGVKDFLEIRELWAVESSLAELKRLSKFSFNSLNRSCDKLFQEGRSADSVV